MADRQIVSDKSTEGVASGSAQAPERTAADGQKDEGVLGMQRLFGNRAVSQMVGSASGSLLVDDDVAALSPGQMRKTEFLTQLRTEVRTTTDDALVGTGRNSEGCPYIERWLSVAAGQTAARVDRGIRLFAPEAAEAKSTAKLLSAVAARVRGSVAQWSKTGDVTAMPEMSSLDLGGGGLAGGLLFKARDGGPRPEDPHSVLGQLGRGGPLDGSVRSRMEPVFGVSFSDVQLHTGSRASSLASQMNARAFTVGEHLAFGPGEYRPGTPEGDALLAHELAHTLQQGAGNRSDGVASEMLESEADRSAAGAVVSLWGGSQGARAEATPKFLPRLRSGLRLSRCGGGANATKTNATDVKKVSPEKPKDAAAPDPVEKTPDPENSYWFEDPKKQVKDSEGDQELDFSKKKDSGTGLTSSAQTRQQVVVDKPGQYSKSGDITVRFAYPASGFSDGKESAEIKSAKAAVLKALADVVTDVGNTPDVTWSGGAKEEAAAKAAKKKVDEQRARLAEVFKGFTPAQPLNIYLAPETPAETISGNFIPTTAQVWVGMNDVGDPTKLKTAMRIPIRHILGGPNPAKGGAIDAQADLKRTLLHESLHALLLNRSADSDAVWRDAQSVIKLEGPDKVQKKTLALIRAYILAQEELFAYNNEESLYPPVTSGPQQSGKGNYEIFKSGADRFFTRKASDFAQVPKQIDVSQPVDKKKVKWEIVYRYPKTMKLDESDGAVLDLILTTWPLR